MLAHAVDLVRFLENEAQAILRFLDDSSDHCNEVLKNNEWVIEHMLRLFAKWATGITTTIIRQDVLNELKTMRNSHHVKPDGANQGVLHGVVQSIGFFPNQDAAVIHIQQPDYDMRISAAVHGALLPFVKRFITEGRKIHFANIHFSNEYMIPSQNCVIDLQKSKDDVDFVIRETERFSLRQLSEESPPGALLLRVDGPTANGISVSDGSEKGAELVLERERMGIKMLLRFGDVIMLYRPWVRQIYAGILSLVYGPNTVMFRLPVTVKSVDVTSQVSQHNASLTQDGLVYRNSAASRAICGTVERIENYVDRGDWSSSTVYLCDQRGHTIIIYINMADCTYESTKVVSGLRPSHFVWFFGLIEREKESRRMYYTSETGIYNTVMMRAIIASEVVQVLPLELINSFQTFVARAVMIKADCSVREVHSICRSAVSKMGHCRLCHAAVSDDIVEELFLQVTIDDGTCDPITVFGRGSAFGFWGVDPGKWKSCNSEKREAILRDIIGCECVFILSRGSEEEFGGFGVGPCWRVDQCANLVGDNEREVVRLCNWHRQLDREKS